LTLEVEQLRHERAELSLARQELLASPSDGAWTTGTPSNRSSCFASATMSRVSRDVIVAFAYAPARSPRASASARACSNSALTARRRSSSAIFSAGGAPSKTNTSFSECSAINRVVLKKRPERCDVTRPLASFSGVPSRNRMSARNW
jgi:hypothetical protein